MNDGRERDTGGPNCSIPVAGSGSRLSLRGARRLIVRSHYQLAVIKGETLMMRNRAGRKRGEWKTVKRKDEREKTRNGISNLGADVGFSHFRI